MLVKVLKAFLYAPDVRTTLSLQPDDVVAIDDSVLQGLHEEGFVAEATEADIEAAQGDEVVVAPPVEIPADYADLQWFKLRKLAQDLGGGAAITKAGALALIAAELKSRDEG